MLVRVQPDICDLKAGQTVAIMAASSAHGFVERDAHAGKIVLTI